MPTGSQMSATRGGRRRRTATALAIALLVLLGTGVKAQARPGLETIVQDDGSLLYRPIDQVRTAMARLRSLGVDTVRLTANWSVLTQDGDRRRRPEFDASDPGAYDAARWRGLDNAIALAGQVGLHAVVDIGFWAPVWATSDRSGPRARTNIDPVAFRDFAIAVARRYSGSWALPAPPADPAPPPPPPPPIDQQLLDAIFGTPAAQPVAQPSPPPGPLPRVARFVLWNEPNHPGLLMPQWVGGRGGHHPQSATIYRRMVQLAYPAVKAIRPDAAVLIGNTSSTGSYRFRGPVPPLGFIRALACVDARFRPLTTGDCRHFSPIPGDGWAHHPYAPVTRPDAPAPSNQPDDVRVADLPKLAKTLARLVAMGRLAPTLRTIYLTEFGYETHPTVGRKPLTQAQQARYLTWAEYLSQRVPSVRSFAQFLLRDQPPGTVRVSDSLSRPFGQYYTGLEESDGQPKLAERSFVAGLFAERSVRGLVMLWTRLRLGTGARMIRFERRIGTGRWRLIATTGLGLGPPDRQLTLDGQESVQRFATLAAGASYRLDYRDANGSWVRQLAVRAVDPRPADRPPAPGH